MLQRHRRAAVAGGLELVPIGGPVHAGHYPTALKHYILAHKAAIDQRPNAFFSVCLHIVTGEAKAMSEALEVARAFTDSCQWLPYRIESNAAALKYLGVRLLQAIHDEDDREEPGRQHRYHAGPRVHRLGAGEALRGGDGRDGEGESGRSLKPRPPQGRRLGTLRSIMP
ncbi:MAG: hypothetical protein IPM46_16795 [Flavobacteriales bacterium]|nr:hypothetical protein [Flavobacteriales bacterium]